MRNLKKLLAVLVVVVMVATTMIPAFAADTTFTYSAQAKTLNDLGLYKGTDPAVFTPVLDKAVDRMTGVALLLRLLGKDAAALALSDADATAALATAVDVKDVAGGDMKKYMAYAVANKFYKGTTTATLTLDAKGPLTGDQFAALLLRNIGFDVDAKDAAALLATKGGLSTAEATLFATKALIRDDLVGMSYAALQAKDSLGKTVIANLIASGAVTEAKAIAAGVYSAVATKATVTAAGAKILKVTFDGAVDTTKTTFAVAKGTFVVNVATSVFATDKMSATLTLATKMTAGDYTVTVSGVTTAAITGKVTVKDETITKMTLGSALVIKRADTKQATTSYAVLNQYDEDMTSIATVTPTSGKGFASVSGGVVTLNNNAGQTGASDTAFANTDKVSVTLVNAATGVFVSAVLNVTDKTQVSDIAITKLYNANGATLQMGMTEPVGNFKLVVEAKDQYGNAMATPGDLDADILINNSNSSVATVAANFGTTTIDGAAKTTLALTGIPAAGTATIRLISKTTGKMASFDVVVKENLKADVFTLSAPTLAVAGESFKVPFTAVDQFGAALTDVSVLDDVSATVTGATSATFVRDYVAGVTNLVIDATHATAAGTVQLTIVTLTGKIASLTISLQAPAIPTVVAAVNAAGGNTSYNPNLAVLASTDVQVGNIVVNDQYGRAFTMGSALLSNTDATKYRFAITTSDSAPGAVETMKDSSGVASVTAYVYDTASTNAGGKITLSGVAKGSVTLTIALQKGDGTAVSNSDLTVTSKVVADADITTYAIDDMGKLLADADGLGLHSVAVTVNGTTADGTKVVVPAVDYSIVKGTADANIILTGNVLTANSTATGLSTADVTVPVIVTVAGANGAVVITKNVTVTAVPAVLKTIALASGTMGTIEDAKTNTVSVEAANIVNGNNAGVGSLGALINDVMSGTDQYGVSIDFLYTYITTNFSAHTITTLAAGDTFNVTIVSDNGVTMVIKFIVKA